MKFMSCHGERKSDWNRKCARALPEWNERVVFEYYEQECKEKWKELFLACAQAFDCICEDTFFRGCMSCFYLTFYAELKAWMEGKKCLMTLEHKKEIRTCIIKVGFYVRNIQFNKNFMQFFQAFICLLFKKKFPVLIKFPNATQKKCQWLFNEVEIFIDFIINSTRLLRLWRAWCHSRVKSHHVQQKVVCFCDSSI